MNKNYMNFNRVEDTKAEFVADNHNQSKVFAAKAEFVVGKIKSRATKMRLKDLVRAIQNLEMNTTMLESRLEYNKEQHKAYLEVIVLRAGELDVEISQLISLRDKVRSMVK